MFTTQPNGNNDSNPLNDAGSSSYSATIGGQDILVEINTIVGVLKLPGPLKILMEIFLQVAAHMQMLQEESLPKMYALLLAVMIS